MRLDAVGEALADAIAMAMQTHERMGILHDKCRAIGDGRAKRLASEVHVLARRAQTKAALTAIEYCKANEMGIRQFEQEVMRRQEALEKRGD